MSESSKDELKHQLCLKDFKLTQILFNDASKKFIGVLGIFPKISENDKAIVLIEKVAFTNETFEADEESKSFLKNADLETVFQNDIYGKFSCSVSADLNKLKVTTIYPATEKHIQKYVRQDFFLVQETSEVYENITLPHLNREQFSLDWVYNILEHKKEVERIVCEDMDKINGFVLLPDLKWDGQVESLYLLAIVRDRNILSIRDLREHHLTLLENVKVKSLKLIEEKYGVAPNQIRAYIHYQPSFYHLHIHFTYIKYDAPGISCEKSHLLDTVINNIKLIPDYYQRATLTFAVRENDKLYQALKEAEGIKKT